MTERRIALLTNFVAPYRIELLRALRDGAGTLRVLVSTPMEPNRDWPAGWSDLDVVVQRTLTVPRVWRHPAGFREALPLHVPLDTRARLRAFEPDVVISAELGMRSMAAARYVQRARIPLLIWATLSERTEQGRGRTRTLLRRWILRRADGVIVNGESGARYVAAFGFREDRIFRVPQPTDPRVVADAPRRRSPGGHRILLAGQLVERKGIMELLRALIRRAEMHPDEEVELDIAGDGPLKKRIQGMETPPGLTVRLKGSVPLDALGAYYARADIVAFPTLADEWGLVVNEAMSNGVPVLGSLYSQAVEDLVDDGVTGWTFRPDRPAEMDAALDAALTASPDRLAAMGRAARARVRHLVPQHAAEQILDAIRHVEGNSPSRP